MISALFRLGSLSLALLSLIPGAPQDATPPSDTELAAITQRGRDLAAYDLAVWHATDALQMANPKTAQGQQSIAHLQNGVWTVVFGTLAPDLAKFSISYQAIQSGRSGQEFAVTHNDPPKEDVGFHLFAARAQRAALAEFGATARPYNSAVLPGPDNRLFVYLYPSPLKAGSYPIGGDIRYLVSADGLSVLEKRILHKTITESQSPKPGAKPVPGAHKHDTDVPEDTDVLHALQQSPPVPEIVTTPHFVYEIAVDGSVHFKKRRK